MIWAANFCFAAFWLFAGAGGLGTLRGSGPVWVPWLAAGLAFTGIALRKTEFHVARGAGFLAATVSPAAFLLPFPFNAAPILLAVAGCLTFSGRGRRAALAFGAAAGILTAQGVVVAVLPAISSRTHEIGFLAWPLHGLTGLFGIESELHSGRLFVHAGGAVHAFRPFAEFLGLWPLVPFVAAGTLWCGRRWPLLLAGVAGAVALRWGVLVALFLDRPSVNLFASPWAAVGTLAVLTVVLARAVPLRRSGRTAEMPSRPWLSWAAAAVASLFITAAITFRDPGEPKGGRILVDEFHSDWEWSEEKLTKELYGEKTVYNYFCLVDGLARTYAAVDRNKEALTPARLAGCDVLILKTPTRAYGPEEVKAIHDFVRAGGGLWLIGDHTDVLGMNTFLNAVAREFGLEFQPDSICGLREPWFQPYAPPRHGRHPAIQSMPPMIFATSCSIRAGPRVRPVIVGDEMFADEIDYGTENFVADMRPSGEEPFGSFIQCAAAGYGRGRVLAFADSTLFSNFFFYLPGIHELALGSVDWLNRRDRWPGLRWGIWSAGAIFVAAGIGLACRRRAWLPEAVLAGLWVGAAAGLTATDGLARVEPPRPVPGTVVSFDFQDPSYRMPLTHRTPAFHGESYHTFFVWVQRMGMVPRLHSSWTEGLADRALVMIEPAAGRDTESLRAYVEAGGSLLVLDDPANASSTANEILRFAGLSFGEAVTEEDYLPAEKTDSIAGVHVGSARKVVGGRAHLVGAKTGAALLSTARVGKGVVAAFGAARLFTVDSMGDTGTVPDEGRQRIYRLQYAIFEEILGLKEPRHVTK